METAIPIVIAVALAESLLLGFWAPFYFRVGIPVFSRALLYRGGGHRAIDPDVLSKAFARSLVPSIVFRAIGSEEIAFRERFFQLTLFHYTPVMRGLIKFDDHSGTVTVRGHANAFPLCFLAMAVAFCLTSLPLGEFEVFFLATVVLVLGVCYAIQARRFNSVYNALKEKLDIHSHSQTY